MIKVAHSCLKFDGNCQQALDFYTQVLGGKVTFTQHFSDGAQHGGEMSHIKEDKNCILDAYFVADKLDFMASDTIPGTPLVEGSNNALAISIDTLAEGKRIFDALANNGKVLMPFQKTFWALGFGGIIDQFGIMWYVNVDDPEYKH